MRLDKHLTFLKLLTLLKMSKSLLGALLFVIGN